MIPGITARGVVSGALSDPLFSSVVLLCGFDGVDGATASADESSYARALTFNGAAQLDTAQKQFGASSLLLDGSGDFLTAAHQAELNFLLGDFTIEGFVRKTTAGRDAIVSKYTDAAGGVLFDVGPSDELRLILGTGSFISCNSGANPVPLNTWTHIAATKSGTTLRVFIGGVVRGTLAITGTVANSGTVLSIGRDPLDTTRDFAGHIDELRITAGSARYTANFTPPAAAFPRS